MDQAGGRVLFVYYKVNQLQHQALLTLVRNFQRRLSREWPGLSCELMQRPPAADEGQPTWMEIYRHVDGISDQMTQGIAALARDMHLPESRFSEVFVPLS